MVNKFFYLGILCGCLIFCASSCRNTQKKGELPLTSSEQLVLEWESSLRDDYAHFSQQLDSILPLLDDSLFYCRGLILKSRAKMFLADHDSALWYLDRVRDFCADKDTTDADIRFLYSRVYNMRGNALARFSLVDSARNEFIRAYQWCLPYSGKKDLLNVSMNIADAYVRGGRFDQGALWYRRALAFADSLQMPDQERFPIYYGLAQVNMELRDFARCDYYYDLAGSYYDKMSVYEKHVYLNNRGNSYYYRQDYQTSFEYFRKVLRLLDGRPEFEFERNLAKVNLGDLFLSTGQLDSAAYYLDQCHGFFKQMNNNSALYYIDTQLIKLALEQNNLALARERMKQAVTPSYVEPNMLHIRNQHLQQYFEKMGDYKKAYEYQTLNQHIDDSIRSGRIKMRAAEIALRYRQDSTLLRTELLLNQKQNEVLRLNQWIYIGGAGILLLAAGGVIWFLYWKRRRDAEEWNMRMAITSLKLENVRNRISPHFIFNVLSREAVLQSGKKESQNLMNLVKLIRSNLDLTNSLSVTLFDELDFVKTYVKLEERSLQPDFQFLVHVEEVDVKSLQVPTMLLQIPTENAVKHALRMKEGKRRLWINIVRIGNCVEMMVRDNGGGFVEHSAAHGTGTGMRVVTQTIQLLNLYNRHPILMAVNNVEVEDGDIGCEVRFSIPMDYSYQLKKEKKHRYGEKL